MKTINKLSLRVVLLFAIAILATFVPEYFRDFFGDWYCNGVRDLPETDMIDGCNYMMESSYSIHTPTYHWGWRHWLWCFMSLTLFVIQVIGIGTDFDETKK